MELTSRNFMPTEIKSCPSTSPGTSLFLRLWQGVDSDASLGVQAGLMQVENG